MRGGGISSALGRIAMAMLFAAPLVLVAAGAFQPVGQPPPTGFEALSPPWSLEAFARVRDLIPLGRMTANSTLVAAVSVPVGVLVAAWTGFAIARLPARAGAFLAVIVLVTALIPVTALVVGRVTIFRLLGVTASPLPLMASALLGVSPLFVLVFAWSYKRLPATLFDLAAEVGLTPLAAWWRIAVPLTRGTTVAVGMLALIVVWGDFIGPLLMVSDSAWYTLPAGLGVLSGLDGPRQPIMLAAALLAMIPVGIALLVLARRPRGHA